MSPVARLQSSDCLMAVVDLLLPYPLRNAVSATNAPKRGLALQGKHSLHISLRRYTCGRVPHPQHQYKAPDMPLLNPSGPATSSLVISTCSPQLSTHSPRTPTPGASFPRTNLSSAYRSILLSHLPPIPLVPCPYPSRFPVICVEAAAKYLCQIYVSRRREPPQPHSHRAPQGPRAGSLVRLQPWRWPPQLCYKHCG